MSQFSVTAFTRHWNPFVIDEESRVAARAEKRLSLALSLCWRSRVVGKNMKENGSHRGLLLYSMPGRDGKTEVLGERSRE